MKPPQRKAGVKGKKGPPSFSFSVFKKKCRIETVPIRNMVFVVVQISRLSCNGEKGLSLFSFSWKWVDVGCSISRKLNWSAGGWPKDSKSKCGTFHWQKLHFSKVHTSSTTWCVCFLVGIHLWVLFYQKKKPFGWYTIGFDFIHVRI